MGLGLGLGLGLAHHVEVVQHGGGEVELLEADVARKAASDEPAERLVGVRMGPGG